MGSSSSRLARLWQPLTLLAFRGANSLAKFALALYTARYLGLADLGVYGLLTGATTLVPGLFGAGTSDWALRQVVGLDRAQAVPLIVTRVGWAVLVQAIVQPLAWALNAALGAPVPWSLAAPIALILFLEHIATDAHDLLIARGRAFLANALLFLRAGFWPLLVIGWGLANPQARTLEWLLIGWIAGLVLNWAVLLLAFVRFDGPQNFALRPRWMASGIRRSWPFFVRDMSAAAGLYFDRFLISVFLGLELTGVYTFYWSVANVVHTLVVFGTVQPQAPRLIAAAQSDPIELHAAARQVGRETAAWTLLMALLGAVALPLMLPLMERPLLEASLPIFWLVLAATTLRIGADFCGYLLLALHRDRAIAQISACGFMVSALLNLAFVPTLGLAGAGLAYLATAAGLFALRFEIARRSGLNVALATQSSAWEAGRR